MAINVNTVYQTVLLILNKEQRGYITPQEFNNIANQVQLEIFNSYFPDGDQANRKNQNNTQNDTEFYNSFNTQDSRLDPFKLTTSEFVYDSGRNSWTYPSNSLPISKIGSVYCNYDNASYKEADRLSYKEYRLTSASKLTSPTKNYPIYNISYIETNFEQIIGLDSYPGGSLLNFPADSNISVNNGVYNKTQGVDYGTISSILSTTPVTQVQVTENLSTLVTPPAPADEILITNPNDVSLYPSLFIDPQPDSIEVSAIKSPRTVTWAYQVQANGSYLYNANSSVDFQLVQDEKSRVILEILKYCGVLIREPEIAQQAAQAEAAIEVNEKS